MAPGLRPGFRPSADMRRGRRRSKPRKDYSPLHTPFLVHMREQEAADAASCSLFWNAVCWRDCSGLAPGVPAFGRTCGVAAAGKHITPLFRRFSQHVLWPIVQCCNPECQGQPKGCPCHFLFHIKAGETNACFSAGLQSETIRQGIRRRGVSPVFYAQEKRWLRGTERTLQ